MRQDDEWRYLCKPPHSDSGPSRAPYRRAILLRSVLSFRWVVASCEPATILVVSSERREESEPIGFELLWLSYLQVPTDDNTMQ